MKILAGLILAILLQTASFAQMAVSSSKIALLQTDDLFDAYSLGQIVYVYRESSFPTLESAVTDLEKLISVDRAAEHGKPDTLMLQQLESRLMGIELSPRLDEAAAMNRGDCGFLWKLCWTLFPAKQNLGGKPWICRTYVGPDGSDIKPELALCDEISFSKGKHGSNCLVSSLPFTRLSKRVDAKQAIHGEDVLTRAQAELKSAVESIDLEQRPSLRFRDQELIKVPFEQLHTGHIENREVWAVHFVPAELQGKDILNADPFTVWVTIDGQVGKLTWNGWSLK